MSYYGNWCGQMSVHGNKQGTEQQGNMRWTKHKTRVKLQNKSP